MTPQNDQRTIKKSTLKTEQKKSEKRTQHGQKNLPRRQPHKSLFCRTSPPHPPSRVHFVEWSATLSRSPQAPSRFPSSAEAPSEANASGRVDRVESNKSQSNPNPSPLGQGFMPPPYPLHGSGSDCCWSAVPKDHGLKAI